MVSRDGTVYRVDPETSAFSTLVACFGADKLHPISELRCEILTTLAEVENISAEWQDLYRRVGGGIFGNFDTFRLWWKNLGQEDKFGLHVAIARSASGELKALLPLVVRRRFFFRILEWAGQEVFDGNDILAENNEDAQTLWRFVCSSGQYDVAAIKDVQQKALSLSPLASLLRLRRQHKNYFLTLNDSSGDDWYAAQPRKFRNDMRRKLKKMETLGPIAFHVHRKGEPVPTSVIDALFEQKKAWVASHNHDSVFLHPKMKPFLHDLASYAAGEGTLYLAWMSCDNKIAGCHMGFIRNEILQLYICSYDSAFAYYSPGNFMMIETIKTAIDAKLIELDLMRGEEDYKHHFAVTYRDLSDFIGGRSLSGKILVRLR
jgi:CelD/BcsL family acetyltransferase involved in cellulose biosynthesis